MFLIISCVTLGQLPNFSGFWFSYLENEMNNSHHTNQPAVKIH